MATTTQALGLTAEELQRHVRDAVDVAMIGNEEFVESVPPAEVRARRVAWEAAAALTAANNRRLTEQLRRLGLLTDADWQAIAAPPEPPADTWGYHDRSHSA